MIVIAVDADALLKFGYRLAGYLKAIIQFFCFNAKLGFTRHTSQNMKLDSSAVNIPS